MPGLPPALTALVAQHVRAELPRLPRSYTWPVPAEVPFGRFERGADALHLANVRLRRFLSEAWRNDPASGADIARWYVSVWGGVRGNRANTLDGYVDAAPEDLIAGGAKGVASWSKVLAVRDPERFLIFDARVAAALNALQVVAAQPTLGFPRLPSRNTIIRDFKPEARFPAATPRARGAEAYPAYLALAAAVAQAVGGACTPELVEMVLFATAEDLVERAVRPEAP